MNYQGDESKITIDADAFIGCPLIGQVSYYNWIASFPNPENVKELTIPNDNIADYEWDGLYNIATLFPNVEKVVFAPEVTRIHDNCLKGARNLKEVEFNEGLQYIGLNIIDDSRLLTSITIPSTVKEMKDYAIVLEGQDVDVTFKTLAFLNASKNNEFVKIYPATYSDGNGESVPSHVSFNFEGIVTIPVYAFQNLEALTNVNLGATSRIGTCAFKGCTNLESIEISENVTYLDKDAFTGMNGKVTLLGTNYGRGGFTDYFGNDVTEVVYGDDITSISFPANYPSLQKLTIGANVETVIGFSQCANLKSVTINSNSFASNANGEGWTQTSIRAHSVGKKTIHHVGEQYIWPSEETTLDVSSRNTIFNFTGTYSGVSGAEMLEKGYYAFGGGSLIQADSADADLLPCRWYMEVVDRNNNPQPSLGKVRVVVRGEDDTTDIKTLVMGNADEASDGAIFDLSGRKVSNAQKGIYIKNGKKIVVR